VKADDPGISTGQAVAVLAEAYGIAATERDVSEALRHIGAEKRWTHWRIDPPMMPGVAGAVMQRAALWWQKRLVRGDRMADVEGLIEGRTVRLMVPLERVWVGQGKPEKLRLYERLPCYEWPTGRVTGWLELDPEQEQYEMTPRYLYTRA
jgi:hypothetical protein